MKSFPGKNHNGFRRGFKASIAATMSLVALSGMGGVATAQSAAPAPSGPQSSASALVNKGEPMRTPAPFAGKPVDSGLKIGAVPAKAGTLMGAVAKLGQ